MTLRIIIHDVGHGQSVHAFTPAGEVIVIDLGCSGDFSPLTWLKDQTNTIDSLVITHPHGDHIDEFLLLNQLGLKPRQFWRPKWLPKEEVYKQNQSTYTTKLDSYYKMSDSYNSTIDSNRLVGNPDVSGGVTIKQFASSSCGVSNINNHSGVVVFEYLGITVVIPGDNEPPSWRALLEKSEFKKYMDNAHVFMASHHGRASGYCTDIFEYKPYLCVVSDGRVQDTDARERYTYHASGLSVKNRANGTKNDRYCLTTRANGYIDIEIGKNIYGEPYLEVSHS